MKLPHILYLVHDLSDPAARRRVSMLKAGGARVTLAGFRRTEAVPAPPPEVDQFDLGRTESAKFAKRVLSVVRVLSKASSSAAMMQGVDAVLCRNLEMLQIGSRLRGLFAPQAALVYESLDVHRLLLSPGVAGATLRWLERRLASQCSMLLTSSPAFIDNYFRGRNRLDVPVTLVENKVPGFLEDAAGAPRCPHGPPWRIGWFGHLRCQRSLDILCEVARLGQGAVEIVLRGVPAEHEFRSFASQVSNTPHLVYEGPYRNPDDLAAIYAGVHFTWAIDFFEEGLNSAWLLPNRLYEGGLYGSVPIALSAVETGAWLERRGLGLRLGQAEAAEIAGRLGGLTTRDYESMRDAVLALPRSTWASDIGDCRKLLAAIVPPSVQSAP